MFEILGGHFLVAVGPLVAGALVWEVGEKRKLFSSHLRSATYLVLVSCTITQ